MAEVRLFPRLSAAAARRLLREHRGALPDAAAARATGEAVAAWAASGGRKVTPMELTGLREALVGIARECGFDGTPGSGDRSGFDAACTVWFGESGAMTTGEGLRDDVWTWIGVCLLPDLVSWRFPGRPEERFLGGVRNVFQRHWMRARALDQGGPPMPRWKLVRAMPEDALVQVMERPSLSSQPELAGAIGRAWLAQSQAYGHRGLEDITREAVREIRILNESRALAALEARNLDSLVQAVFADVAARHAASDAQLGLPLKPEPASAPPRRRSLMGALLGRGRA